jgi:hypothetical protein
MHPSRTLTGTSRLSNLPRVWGASLTSRVAVKLPRVQRIRVAERTIAFALPFAVYLTLAVVLVLDRHLIVGDALSRVGSASYVLLSRDPHLGAIGFVWGPLPTLLVMPFVPLRAIWPPLVEDGFAASLVSAVAMAGAVRQLAMMLADWGVARGLRWALIAAFALHPLVLQYGANGDSEAIFLLLLMLTVRHLVAWLQTGRVSALTWVAVAVSLAYLTRYETIAAAVAIIGLVAAATYLRAPGERRARAVSAVADGLVVGLPFTLSFALWALASWIIVGNPFEQFASVYGTSAQLAAGAAGIPDSSSPLTITVGQILGLEPFVLVAIALAGIEVLRRRDVRVIAVVAVFGAVLTFAVVAWLTGRTGGWLRYTITTIPLTVLLFGAWLAPPLDEHERRGMFVVPAGAWLRSRLVLMRARVTSAMARLRLVGPELEAWRSRLERSIAAAGPQLARWLALAGRRLRPWIAPAGRRLATIRAQIPRPRLAAGSSERAQARLATIRTQIPRPRLAAGSSERAQARLATIASTAKHRMERLGAAAGLRVRSAVAVVASAGPPIRAFVARTVSATREIVVDWVLFARSVPALLVDGARAMSSRLDHHGPVAAVVVVAMLLTAVPSTLQTMVDPVVGREDHYWGFEQPRYVIARQVADYVDDLQLPDGAVLVDTFLGFPIVLDSARPRQFVITSDRDFKPVVTDPITFSVRYVLVPAGGGLGGLDAIERQWPSMYETGAGIGRLVREFGIEESAFRWRLYELGAGLPR